MAKSSQKARQQRAGVKARKKKGIAKQAADQVTAEIVRETRDRMRANRGVSRNLSLGSLMAAAPLLTAPEREAKRDADERFLCRLFGEEYRPGPV